MNTELQFGPHREHGLCPLERQPGNALRLTFICPCIANIFPNYYQQDATFLIHLFISTDVLHVSGGSSAHHQEHTTLHTASGIVTPILLLTATMDEISSTVAVSSSIG